MYIKSFRRKEYSLSLRNRKNAFYQYIKIIVILREENKISCKELRLRTIFLCLIQQSKSKKQYNITYKLWNPLSIIQNVCQDILERTVLQDVHYLTMVKTVRVLVIVTSKILTMQIVAKEITHRLRHLQVGQQNTHLTETVVNIGKK